MPNVASGQPSPSMHDHHEDETVIDLRMLYHLLMAHKIFIGIIVAVFLILGSLYAFTRTPLYESTALIEVQGSSSQASNLSALMNIGGAAGAAGFSASASPSEVETSLLQSEYIMTDVINQLKLNINVQPHYLPFFGKVYAMLNANNHHSFVTKLLPSFSWSVKDTLDITELSVPNYLEGTNFRLVVDKAPGHYTVYSEKGEKLFQGSVGKKAVSSNAQFPISLTVSSLNALPGTSFIVTKNSTKTVMENILSHFTIAEKGDRTGILELAYQSPNPDFSQQFLNAVLNVVVAKNIATKAEEAGKTLDFLKKQLPTVTQQLDSAESTLNSYRSESGNIDSQTEAEILLQQVVALQQEIEDMKLKKLQLLQSFTEQHPYVIAMSQQQAAVQEQLDNVEARLRELPQAVQEAANFQRDISVQGGIYTNVIQNMQQMEMLKASTVSTVRILTNASFAVLPVKSKAPLIVLISVMLGFFLAFGILLLRQALMAKIEDPLAVEKALGISTLAIVPYSRYQVALMKKMREAREKNSYLLSEFKPKDVTVESLRGLRTSLRLALLEADRKIISISGCSPGIGKSFLSSNLAKLFAELGSQVLLIDADMRKGHAYKILGADRSPGLAEYLKNTETSLEAVTQQLTNVNFIPTGEYPADPTELLMRDKFHQLLDTAAEKYDVVLIDTPPILAVTDAALILKYTAINLLVVGSGKDQLREIQHAKSTLEKGGVKISGTVFNHLSESANKYGAGGHYNYYYSYE